MNDLVLINNVTITEIGLTEILIDSYDEWAAIGPALGRASRSLAWAIADWLNYGEWKWGEMYVQAAESTGLSIGRLRNLKWLGSQVPYQVRQPGLSLSHHEAVAPLALEEQRRLLIAAKENNVTRDGMRQIVADFKTAIGLLPEEDTRWQEIPTEDVLDKALDVAAAFMQSPIKTTDMTLHQALTELCDLIYGPSFPVPKPEELGL